jgi:hemerythrin superfamily protein
MQHAPRRSTARASSPARRQRAAGGDAIALLKADHRQVETMFEQFEKSRSDRKKADLATNICESLRVHMAIEEEIFYPAFLEATGAEDLHHEAEIEHAGARNLMAQIEDSDPSDDYFDARVKVLSEMIKHHVKEEEQRDGMFAKAKSSDMDMAVVAEQMLARKSQLEAEGTDTLN